MRFKRLSDHLKIINCTPLFLKSYSFGMSYHKKRWRVPRQTEESLTQSYTHTHSTLYILSVLRFAHVYRTFCAVCCAILSSFCSVLFTLYPLSKLTYCISSLSVHLVFHSPLPPSFSVTSCLFLWLPRPSCDSLLLCHSLYLSFLPSLSVSVGLCWSLENWVHTLKFLWDLGLAMLYNTLIVPKGNLSHGHINT